MLTTVLRKEHKNRWERRVALSPTAAGKLVENGQQLVVERSEFRVYSDSEYTDQKVELVSTANDSQLVLGIKEPPVESIQTNQVHLCFSHTIKGQDYNMPLLQRFIDARATLIDYELMRDSQGVRTIAFGRYAGIAGAIDTFWAYGKQLYQKGVTSAFSEFQQTWKYGSVAQAHHALKSINLASDAKPHRIIILGSGKVGKGSAEVCEWLGLRQIQVSELYDNTYPANESWYCIIETPDLYERIDTSGFDRDEYYQYGKERYRSRFCELLGHCDVVLLTSFWTEQFPRHMELKDFKTHVDKLPTILGDISCDIDGAFACTSKITDIDNPVYTYNPETGTSEDGLSLDGIAIMAIDNLPCELSQDASDHFSSVLVNHIPALMALDLSLSFDALALEPEVKNAVIVYNGKLTPEFEYLKQYLAE